MRAGATSRGCSPTGCKPKKRSTSQERSPPKFLSSGTFRAGAANRCIQSRFYLSPMGAREKLPWFARQKLPTQSVKPPHAVGGTWPTLVIIRQKQSCCGGNSNHAQRGNSSRAPTIAHRRARELIYAGLFTKCYPQLVPIHCIDFQE